MTTYLRRSTSLAKNCRLVLSGVAHSTGSAKTENLELKPTNCELTELFRVVERQDPVKPKQRPVGVPIILLVIVGYGLIRTEHHKAKQTVIAVTATQQTLTVQANAIGV